MALLILLLIRGTVWAQPSPGPLDPVHLLARSERQSTVLVGRLLRDLRSFESGCSGVLAVDLVDGRRGSGRTQVLQRPCQTSRPLQAWRVTVEGRLQLPATGGHPLLSG